MPNLQQLLSEEIRRLARKEIKNELGEQRKQLVLMRKTIIDQNRRIKMLEKMIPVPAKPELSAPEVSAEAKSVRITAKQIRALREKFGLSQGKFAILLGVNLNSVRYWESEKVEPREAQKRKVAAIRDMGKRELAKLMKEKNISTKSFRTSNKQGKAINKLEKQGEKPEDQTQDEKNANHS